MLTAYRFSTPWTLLRTALFVLMPLCVPACVPAQSGSVVPVDIAHRERLIIRLINADTGDPMSHQNVIVEWDADAEESNVYVGGHGRGEMSILPGGQVVTLRPGFKNWGDPNRLAYYSCSGSTTEVPILDAIRTGYVAHNECNGRTTTVQPGEIVFWARPLPLWKPDFQ